MGFTAFPNTPAFIDSPTVGGTYYAATNGTPGGTGSIGSPWDLQTALNFQIGNLHTIIMGQGTYTGKYVSNRTAGTVKAYAGASYNFEQVTLDGFVHSTLVGDITSNATTVVLASGTGFMVNSDEFCINREVLKGGTLATNTISNISIRGASGTVGGAQAHSNGAIVNMVGSVLKILGNNTLYDFTGVDVMQSDTRRDEGDISELTRGNGIHIIGQGNLILNPYVHDNESGCFSSSASANTQWEGVISVNNGTYNTVTPAGHGHGFYLENGSGYSRVFNCASLNNFNLGGQGYGVTASYNGGNFQNSVFANSGAPLGIFDPEKRNYNLIIGPDSVRSDTFYISTCYFFHPHDLASPAYQVNFGYGAGINTATIHATFCEGGTNLLQIGDITTATIFNNDCYTRQPSGVQYTIARPHLYTWTTSTYWKSQGRDVFAVTGVGLYSFANWKVQTGYDANSTQTNTDPPDGVFYNNEGQRGGYTMLWIKNIDDDPTQDIAMEELGVPLGAHFKLKNAFDFQGTSVYEGVNDSEFITIDMQGAITNVATPIGLGYTPPTTSPDFAVLVVVPGI